LIREMRGEENEATRKNETRVKKRRKRKKAEASRLRHISKNEPNEVSNTGDNIMALDIHQPNGSSESAYEDPM
jgi:hypothetical protein